MGMLLIHDHTCQTHIRFLGHKSSEKRTVLGYIPPLDGAAEIEGSKPKRMGLFICIFFSVKVPCSSGKVWLWDLYAYGWLRDCTMSCGPCAPFLLLCVKVAKVPTPT